MSQLKVLTYPDPFLRRTVKPVPEVNDSVRRTIADMAETMYASAGAGLAAIQVGIDQRIIIFDVSGPEEHGRYQALVNPVVIHQEGSTVSENEGCLSVPDFRADVKRAASVRVEALDSEGRPVVIEDDGFLAIVLQHEIDHLDGVLFIDRISSLKRELYKRRIKKRQRSGETQN